MQRSQASLILSLTAISLCTVTLGFVGASLWTQRAGTLPEDELDALRLVHHRILEDYVFDQDAGDLVYRAIEGMVSSLDEFSRFVPPPEVSAFVGEQIEGTFEGIGVRFVRREGALTVYWPLEGGPAERAGLKVGDRIVSCDGIPVQFEDARRIDGPAGTSIRLQIARDRGADGPSADAAPDEFTVDVERAAVRRPSILHVHRCGARNDIGYLHVREFHRDVVVAVDGAIDALTAPRDGDGGALRGLILDLRGNPGGLLTEGILLANRFLREGTIVSLKRRSGVLVEEHAADPDLCTLPDLPLVVLIDRKSASASEVVAAALQDHSRATLVGERSFGKGVVQQIYRWSNRDFRLKITSSHYYTPNGRNLSKSMRRVDDGDDEHGVDPDCPVALTRNESHRLRHNLSIEIPARYRAAAHELAGRLGIRPPAQPSAADDPVFARGLAVLEDRADETEKK